MSNLLEGEGVAQGLGSRMGFDLLLWREISATKSRNWCQSTTRHRAKGEYARLSGKDRRFINCQKYTLLSPRENLTLEGWQALKTLLAANRRLNVADTTSA